MKNQKPFMSLSKERTLSDPIQIHCCGTGGRSMITPEIEYLKGIEETMSNCINEFVLYAPTSEVAMQMEDLCNKVLDILQTDKYTAACYDHELDKLNRDL